MSEHHHKKLFYVLGNFGAKTKEFATKLSEQYPEANLLLFEDILMKQPSFITGQEIVSYPSYLRSEVHVAAQAVVEESLVDSFTIEQSLILAGTGSNGPNILPFFKSVKLLGYHLTIYYIDVNVKDQIENLKSSSIPISYGTLVDTQTRLKSNLPAFMEIANRFIEIIDGSC